MHFFTTILASTYTHDTGPTHGYWHAAIFDKATGEQIGVTCSIRFDLNTEEAGS